MFYFDCKFNYTFFRVKQCSEKKFNEEEIRVPVGAFKTYSLRILTAYFSDPYFPAFGLNTERYGVSHRIQSECGEIPTRKTPNTDTFHAVTIVEIQNFQMLECL